jgi:hypothetical protein
MSACYWPLDFHFLAWVALVPWLAVLPRLGAGRAWLFGTVLGLAFYRIGLAWLCTLAGPLGAAAVRHRRVNPSPGEVGHPSEPQSNAASTDSRPSAVAEIGSELWERLAFVVGEGRAARLGPAAQILRQ